jgi:hypothetical protein
MYDLLLGVLVSVPASIAVVEMLLRCPLLDIASRLGRQAGRSARVLLSKSISDHHKEKVLPVYAGRILVSSLAIAFWLGLLLALFVGVYALTNAAATGSFDIAKPLSGVAPLVQTTVVGLAYLTLRGRFVG